MHPEQNECGDKDVVYDKVRPNVGRPDNKLSVVTEQEIDVG